MKTVPSAQLHDWDDVRYFLAVAREGSVRAASDRLGVNHSTVLRRIAQLEERLGAAMFEKLPAGYRLTAAGEEVLEFAEEMEAASHRLATRVFGRDQNIGGPLRVTLSAPLATHLLMTDFVSFARLYPEIEMELFGGVYMSRDLLAAWRAGAPDRVRWIVNSEHGIPEWASEGEVRTTETPFRTTDGEASIVAVRQGLGMTTLPCFIGDADPLLARVPGTPHHKYGTLWLLTQAESRKTRRVRLFLELIAARLAEYAPLLAGHSPLSTPARLE